MFPVLFIKERLDINLDLMVKDILDARETTDYYTSYHEKGYDVYNLYGMEELRASVGHIADEYLKEINVVKKCEQYHVNMWWNVYDKNVSHQLHNHPRSMLSGTFYVNMNDKCCLI